MTGRSHSLAPGLPSSGEASESNHYPLSGRSFATPSILTDHRHLSVDDEADGYTPLSRRRDCLDSQGSTASDLRSSVADSRSPSLDRRTTATSDNLLVPRRGRASRPDTRRSFYSSDERDRRRSYYLDDSERAGPSYRRSSSSDRRLELRIPNYDDELTRSLRRRTFYVSESDSDVHLDDLLSRHNCLSSSIPTEARINRYEQLLSGERTSSSDSHSEDERGGGGSAYSSCSSVNDIVDRFKDYNRRVRDMVVNSISELGDNAFNQGTSETRLPMLQFHTVHGQNVVLQKDRRISRRKESFCKGLAFSNRPIAIDENVCIRLVEVASNWSGVLRFGLTNVDPETYRGAVVPKFACPDLTSKEGYWAKALPERYSVEGNIIHFYVNSEGELHYGVNGRQKGIFLSAINIRSPLWVIVDIYGNSVAVEFVDPKEFGRLPTMEGPMRPGPPQFAPPSIPSVVPTCRAEVPTSSTTQDSAASSSATSRAAAGDAAQRDNLMFHRIVGSNISLNGLRTLASRPEREYTQGYVFTERPIRINEVVVVQVAAVQSLYKGGLCFGVTCCDPSVLSSRTLPDDSSDLIEFPEYWVGIKDVALDPPQDTVLRFWIGPEGEVYMKKNEQSPNKIMHVDHTLQLYMYFDVYGSTKALRLLGVEKVPTPGSSNSIASSVTTNRVPTRVALPVLPSTSSRAKPAPTRPASDSGSSIGTPLRVVLDGMRIDSTQGARRGGAPAIPPRTSTMEVQSSVDALLSLDDQPSTPAITPSVLQPRPPQRAPPVPPTSTANPFTSSQFASNNQHNQDAENLSVPPPIVRRTASTAAPGRPAPPIPATRPAFAMPSAGSVSSFLSGTQRSQHQPTIPALRASQGPFSLASLPAPTSAPAASSAPTTPAPSISGSQSGGLDEDDVDECCICMNDRKDCAIIPCGHVCMCYGCASQLMQAPKRECPMCRKKMDNILKIYK